MTHDKDDEPITEFDDRRFLATAQAKRALHGETRRRLEVLCEKSPDFRVAIGKARMVVVGIYRSGRPAVSAVMTQGTDDDPDTDNVIPGETWGKLTVEDDRLKATEVGVKTWAENEEWWRDAVDALGLVHVTNLACGVGTLRVYRLPD